VYINTVFNIILIKYIQDVKHQGLSHDNILFLLRSFFFAVMVMACLSERGRPGTSCSNVR
jgi:hypothetical protein